MALLRTQIIASFVLLGVLGLFAFCVTAPVITMANMQVSSCHMADHDEICPMIANSQLRLWQAVVVPSSGRLSILALVPLLAFFWNGAIVLEASHNRPKPTYDSPLYPLFDYLQRLFSAGILRPKLH